MCNTFSILPCPVFSVIIPVYNVAPYLRACLDSVLAAVREADAAREAVEKVGGGGERNGKASSGFECSTASVQPTVEIICVDDGSVDGSGRMLDEYLSGKGSDPLPERCCFRVIHQRNAGVSAARNAALDVAKGDWILFVDADDVVAPNYFSVLVDAAQSHGEVDLLAFGYVEFNEMSIPTFCNSGLPWQVVDISERLSLSVIDIDLWRAAFRRAVMPAHWFRPYCRGEDMLFVSECLCTARKLAVSSQTLYGYRVRKGSAMRSPITVKKLVDRIGYVRERVETLKHSGKQVDGSAYRIMGLNLTEGFVAGIRELMGDDDKDEMWRRWQVCLAWIKGECAFPQWVRMVAVVCHACPWRWLAWALCFVPWWLKTKGVHR